MLEGARHDRHRPVYLDEAPVHRDADLGPIRRTSRCDGGGVRGERFHVASSSPGSSARVSFYGLYLYNDGRVRPWPYPRAKGEHTGDVLRRPRAEPPDGKLVVVWDGAPDHRAKGARAVAADLGIELAPPPGYSPDLMPVEALWRRLREDVTDHPCHATAEDRTRRVAAFETRIDQDPYTIADRLWVKDRSDPEEEKLRFST